MAYGKAADAAVAYLAKRVLDEAWAADHDDVAYYFKAPMAFLEAGVDHRGAAERALAIAGRYADRGGADSANGAYAGMFQHYPLMWICWAAVRLEQQQLAKQCYENLWKYVEPSSCAGLVKEPYRIKGAAYEADLFATAEVVKVALLMGRAEVAARAGETMLKALNANTAHMEQGRFYLRWSGEAAEEGGLALVREEDMFHCVTQALPGQLYFLLAFPAMALLELAGADGGSSSEACRQGALRLLGFLRECKGVYESPMAHKVGRAAAMAGDATTARKIADYLVSLQQESGCFQPDPEAVDSLDQTAEIAVWLRQIEQDLV